MTQGKGRSRRSVKMAQDTGSQAARNRQWPLTPHQRAELCGT